MTTGVPPRTLGHGELLQLRRWNTPTIYNGRERITRHDVAAAEFNVEETRDFMPHLGPAIMNYESANRALPPTANNAWAVPNTNDFAMTPRLLPFLEQTPLYSALNMSHTFGNTSGVSSDPNSSNLTVEGR
jgi:hypothetical protein